MDELELLYKVYQSNIKTDRDIQPTVNENNSFIKVGDIVVALYNAKEVRGEISSVFENNKFELKGKNGNKIKIVIDDIMEHYPKNRYFENKLVKKDEDEDESQQQEVRRNRKKLIDEKEREEIKNSPDNQVDLTMNEKIKVFGKVIKYQDVKYSDIENMFEKNILSKNKIWYCITEKNGGEIHIIRENEIGFKIQPFVMSLMDHFLKVKSVNEGYNQIRIKGNDNFAVLSNVPKPIYEKVLGSLISLLSK